MDTLMLGWAVVMTVLLVGVAALVLRCYLRSRAVEKRIEREIDKIWGD